MSVGTLFFFTSLRWSSIQQSTHATVQLSEQPNADVAEKPQLWKPFVLSSHEPILAQLMVSRASLGPDL
jgi:hypothetical protein